MSTNQHYALHRLDRLLTAARSLQWDAPPSLAPAPVERRSSGPISDPTADIALDERRLAVRDAVKHAEDFVAFVDHMGPSIERSLAGALSRWEGRD